MKLLLVVLSLCVIIEKCYSVPCTSLAPGIDRLSLGIDITTFDMFPTDMTAQSGLARSIFDYTCNRQRKWQNPFTNIIYDLPDQIESVTMLPGGVMSNTVEVINDYHEVQKSHSRSLGLGIVGGLFGLSGSTHKAMITINLQEKTMTTVSAHVSAFAAELIPSWTANAGAYVKQFYDQFLPNTYQENPGKYQEFLSLFGTHYFQTAHFGGKMRLQVETLKTYNLRGNAASMAASAQATFYNTLTLSGGHKGQKIAVDKHYTESSTFAAYYYGGIADLIKTGLSGFDNWMMSVHKSPWLFGGQLRPIVDLLPDGPKKNAINTAITIKLDYAYLDEMVNSINVLKQNPYIDMAGANSLITQVVALRGQVIPPHDKVAQLGAAVDGFVGANKGKTAPKPACKVVYDSKQKKNVCVNPTTCTCTIH